MLVANLRCRPRSWEGKAMFNAIPNAPYSRIMATVKGGVTEGKCWYYILETLKGQLGLSCGTRVVQESFQEVPRRFWEGQLGGV